MSATSKATNVPLLVAGIFGLTGVALGALGAHALKVTLLERGMMQAWETAARYHLFHAVALIAIGVWVRLEPNDRIVRWLSWTTRSWCVGVVLFSSSLYWLALGGPRWLGPVTPLGGVALMLGWLCVMATAFSKRE